MIPVAAPYSFALGPEVPQLDIGRSAGTKEFFARLTPDNSASAGYTSEISHDTPSLVDVVDVVRGPTLDGWWLETSLYRVPLPAGWKAIAEGQPNQPCMFDLIGPDGALMFVQTPNNAPDPDRLAAPGQRVHARGSDARSHWVELRYEHDAREWAQRHDVVRVGLVTCALTVQCPVVMFDTITSTHRAVLHAIAPGGKHLDAG